FGSLKLVPGVADVAAPVLGGETRRDASDLIALSILLPLWLALRPPGRAGDAPAHAVGDPAPGGRMLLRSALATMAPIVGLVVATAATTATSCGPRPAVVMVTAKDDHLYAL